MKFAGKLQFWRRPAECRPQFVVVLGLIGSLVSGCQSASTYQSSRPWNSPMREEYRLPWSLWPPEQEAERFPPGKYYP